MSSRSRLRSSPSPCRVSQVPGPICPRALSPITPEGPAEALLSLTHHRRRRASPLSGGLATFALCNEAESGSLDATARAFARRGFGLADCSENRPPGYLLNDLIGRGIYLFGLHFPASSASSNLS